MAGGHALNDTPGQILAGIDGWEDATVQALSGGLSNRAWLVEANQRRAVLKIDAPSGPGTWNSRTDEAIVQMQAAKAGLANAVLFSTDTVLLTEYVDGRVLARKNLTDRDTLAAIANAMRNLHRLPGTGRRFDATVAAREYARTIDSRESERVAECIRKIEAVPLSGNLSCCHNDLVAENMIAIPELRFLDWEFACDNDPLFDLATVIAHHDLGNDAAGFLLDAYFDGDGQRCWARLEQQMELYRALLWLWQRSRA